MCEREREKVCVCVCVFVIIHTQGSNGTDHTIIVITFCGYIAWKI